MTSVLPLQVASSPQRLGQSPRHFARPIASVTLALSLLVGTLPFTAPMATATTPVTGSLTANLADGTYVFGESPIAGQRGVTYMVFQVRSQQVVGGFYQPSSSFDCFHGQISHQEINLTVLPSYEEAAYPFSLALAASDPVAASTGAVGALVPSGFQAVPELTETDQYVLATCQAQI